MNAWLLLVIAIVAEVIGTSQLRQSNGFARLWPSAICLLGFAVALYCLSLSLREIPMGVAYAVWSGLGTVLITLSGWWWFGQKLHPMALVGIGLIIAGIILMNIYNSGELQNS